MRVLCSTTANDGHFGPLVPFARACAEAGHEVRVAAPESFAAAVERAGFAHEPFGDVPPELIGPVMARLPTLTYAEANDVVIRDVFARIDAQAALPALLETMGRWRPDVVVRESAELASLAAARSAGVPHVHVCIGMHEVASRFADSIREPLEELGELAGLPPGELITAIAGETVLSSVPEVLDHAGHGGQGGDGFLRFHEHPAPAGSKSELAVGDPDLPLVYVTFGSVAGSLPHLSGVFRDAVSALAVLDVRVLMTVGRRVEPEDLGPLPPNAVVRQWVPQSEVLQHAAAMLGHGGFGTTMGALAAGVPQVVVPLFSFDQVVNGEHVAAVGAGLVTGTGAEAVAEGAAAIPALLGDPSYVASARRVAEAIAELPPPSEAVPVIASAAG